MKFEMDDGSIQEWTEVKPGQWVPSKQADQDFINSMQEGTGNLEAMAIGAGKKTNDLVQGVKQLFQGDDPGAPNRF